MITEVSDIKEYDQIVKENKIVFIDFYAEWCGPCKRISPYIDDLSELFDHIKFIKIDVDKMEQLSNSFKIQAMPTFLILKNGKEETRITGADKDKIKKMLLEY
jgi:thioredoxin 1